ncbi:MAG: 50S ribosomal protein L24e [Candidatus Micrarchaeota archaeon]|nr:50S ribosomal protein L24e [Candidatus Micrarchaeota archaeon]
MKCTHCSKEIPKGTGTMYVYKIGNISYFCSNRCYKNEIILHRKLNPKEIRGKKVAAK